MDRQQLCCNAEEYCIYRFVRFERGGRKHPVANGYGIERSDLSDDPDQKRVRFRRLVHDEQLHDAVRFLCARYEGYDRLCQVDANEQRLFDRVYRRKELYRQRFGILLFHVRVFVIVLHLQILYGVDERDVLCVLQKQFFFDQLRDLSVRL